MGDFEQALHYLEAWKVFLHPDVQSEYAAFCAVMVDVARRKFEDLQDRIENLPLKDEHLKIHQKILLFQLMIERDLGAVDWFEEPRKIIRNLYDQIKRFDLSETHAVPYLKFCSYGKKLIQTDDKAQLQLIREHLESEERITNLEWLKSIVDRRIQEG